MLQMIDFHACSGLQKFCLRVIKLFEFLASTVNDSRKGNSSCMKILVGSLRSSCMKILVGSLRDQSFYLFSA